MSDEERIIGTRPMAIGTRHIPRSYNAHHACFVLFLMATIPIGWKFLVDLVADAIKNESSSHILLVPFIAIFMVFVDRRNIFGARTGWSFGVGSATIAAGLSTLLWFSHLSRLEGSWSF